MQQGFSREFFDYGAEHPDVLIGSAYFYRPDCVLRVFGQDLLVLRGSEAPGAPYRISGSFFHANGRLMFEVEENCWKGVTGNWDIEMSGPRITIRRGPGDIALVLRTEPRKSLVIERLDMYFKGVRVFADERGVCFGPPEKELYGFKGTIINPVCCLDVSKDDGRQISCAVQLGTPFGGQFTNNTICAAELAFCIRGQGLVLGIGYQAIKVTGDLVKILP